MGIINSTRHWAILGILFLCSGCGMEGDVRFIAEPSVKASYQVQMTQGQQIQTATGYKALVTIQSLPQTEATAPGYKAIIQPVIR